MGVLAITVIILGLMGAAVYLGIKYSSSNDGPTPSKSNIDSVGTIALSQSCDKDKIWNG